MRSDHTASPQAIAEGTTAHDGLAGGVRRDPVHAGVGVSVAGTSQVVSIVYDNSERRMQLARQRRVRPHAECVAPAGAGPAGPFRGTDGCRDRQSVREDGGERGPAGYDVGKKIKGRKRHIVRFPSKGSRPPSPEIQRPFNLRKTPGLLSSETGRQQVRSASSGSIWRSTVSRCTGRWLTDRSLSAGRCTATGPLISVQRRCGVLWRRTPARVAMVGGDRSRSWAMRSGLFLRST